MSLLTDKRDLAIVGRRVEQLAVISDVHADIHALRDALGQVERLGIERVVCCGDLVDYGLFPEETIGLLRERRIPTVRGNHDREAIRDGADVSGWDLSGADVPRNVAGPMGARLGGLRVIATHARPGSDTRGIDPDASDAELTEMLDEAGADVLLVGHTPCAVRACARRRPPGVQPRRACAKRTGE